MKRLCLLTGIAGLSLTLGACAAPRHDAPSNDLPPGQYTKTTHSTDANGTEYDKTTTTTVGTDDGDKSVSTDTTNTVDPAGLFNRSTTTSSTTETSPQ